MPIEISSLMNLTSTKLFELSRTQGRNARTDKAAAKRAVEQLQNFRFASGEAGVVVVAKGEPVTAPPAAEQLTKVILAKAITDELRAAYGLPLAKQLISKSGVTTKDWAGPYNIAKIRSSLQKLPHETKQILELMKGMGADRFHDEDPGLRNDDDAPNPAGACHLQDLSEAYKSLLPHEQAKAREMLFAAVTPQKAFVAGTMNRYDLTPLLNEIAREVKKWSPASSAPAVASAAQSGPSSRPSVSAHRALAAAPNASVPPMLGAQAGPSVWSPASARGQASVASSAAPASNLSPHRTAAVPPVVSGPTGAAVQAKVTPNGRQDDAAG
jgi:hypothetical protein